MRRRLALAVCALALAGGSCSVGRLDHFAIMCSGHYAELPTSVVLGLQAVPTARYVPCVEELPVGWELEPLTAESGAASFGFSAAQLGGRFLMVTLSSACDPTAAAPSVGKFPGAQYWVDVEEEVASVHVQVLPVSSRHNSYARGVATVLSNREVKGLPVAAAAAPSLEPMADRIAAGRQAGATVLIVDDDDVYRGTMSMRLANGGEIAGLGTEEVLTAIAETAPDPAYRATWYHTYEGGCVTMEIDAEGPGAGSIAEEISDSITLINSTELRDYLRRAGYESVG